MHPKDWANPGRAKVKLKGGSPITNIKNSMSLHFMPQSAQTMKNGRGNIEVIRYILGHC